MDGRHGSAKEGLLSIDQVPIPAALLTLPCLHKDRPRGSKAMIDAHGANCRLANCRSGAWVLSPGAAEIEKLVDEFVQTHPNVSRAKAYEQVMRTPVGKEAYNREKTVRLQKAAQLMGDAYGL